MNTNRKHRAWRWTFVVAVALAGCLTPSMARAASSGLCVTVDVDLPVVLPDASIVPPGRLMLCDSLEYSPVATLHKTYLDGRPVGILLSRKRAGEGDMGSEPRVLFRGDGKGQLELVGYVLPGRNGSVAFLLSDRPSTKEIASAPLLARR
jgi:hypothetical protein